MFQYSLSACVRLTWFVKKNLFLQFESSPLPQLSARLFSKLCHTSRHTAINHNSRWERTTGFLKKSFNTQLSHLKINKQTTLNGRWLRKVIVELPGIEPGAFPMQSERSTTELHPPHWNKVQNTFHKIKVSTFPQKLLNSIHHNYFVLFLLVVFIFSGT